MTLDALTHILDRVNFKVQDFHASPNGEKRYIVSNGNGQIGEVIKIDDGLPLSVSFEDLDSWLEFLHEGNFDKGANPPLALLCRESDFGATGIGCDLGFRERNDRKVRARLEPSDCFDAFVKASSAIRGPKSLTDHTQKELWRLLNTSLFGHISPALMLQVSNIKISGKSEQSVQIDQLGVGNASAEQTVKITYGEAGNKADQSAVVGMDWTFTGPRWNRCDVKVEIPFKLEIEKSDAGLVFRIFPIGIREIEEEAQRDLVEKIATSLPDGMKLYCGKAG